MLLDWAHHLEHCWRLDRERWRWVGNQKVLVTHSLIIYSSAIFKTFLSFVYAECYLESTWRRSAWILLSTIFMLWSSLGVLRQVMKCNDIIYNTMSILYNIMSMSCSDLILSIFCSGHIKIPLFRHFQVHWRWFKAEGSMKSCVFPWWSFLLLYLTMCPAQTSALEPTPPLTPSPRLEIQHTHCLGTQYINTILIISQYF